MRVVLIGYRGSGKSVVGRAMAQRLELAFIDTDEEIESRDGRAIAEIFAEESEAGFRDLEREMIAELSGRDSVIIAAGGGAVVRCRPANPLCHMYRPAAQLRRLRRLHRLR